MNDSLTIAEARDLMRPHLKTGTECLCCSQHVQMYSRSVTWSMVYGLILIYNRYVSFNSNAEWIHLENFFKPLNIPPSIRTNVPLLRFWGLIEQKEGENEDGNPKNGYYKITQKGVDFSRGSISIPYKVKLYNNKFYGFEGDNINIYAAIKNKFDYSKLMNGG